MTSVDEGVIDTGRDNKGIVDQTGRALGSRALKKRRLFLDSTAQLLEQQSLREIHVVDIARAVNSSPATFYQYFKDVEDVVLQLANEAADAMPTLLNLFDKPWDTKEGMSYAREIVDSFIQYWDQYGAVLRVRNLAADEGDNRFMKVRGDAMKPFLEAMSSKISACRIPISADANKAGHFNPMAAAVALSSMIDRLSAFHTELEGIGISREDLLETTAQILHRTMIQN